MRQIKVRRLGLMPYQQAFEYQNELFQDIIQFKKQSDTYSGPNYLILVEHPHVYTIGKSGKMNHLLAEESFLKGKGIEVIRNNRGGDITYHGPGQMVVYPILDLGQFFTDLKKYINTIEEVVIRTLADFGIKSERSEGETGVWVRSVKTQEFNKICAIGLRMSRWVSMHGLALNVNSDLDYFKYIVPCGICDKGVTSIEKELGKKVDVNLVFEKFLFHFQDLFETN